MILRESYLNQIRPFMNQGLIKVLVGVRRSGKTVLLSQIRDLLLADGVRRDHILEANFESMKFSTIHDSQALYHYISRQAATISKARIFLPPQKNTMPLIQA